MYRKRPFSDNKFITLAIHSQEYAHKIIDILKEHDINVKQEPIFDGKTGIIIGILLRVHENSLSSAIKITESLAHDNNSDIDKSITGMSKTLLVPIDFSDYSFLAAKFAFQFAQRLSLEPLFLYCFPETLKLDINNRQSNFIFDMKTESTESSEEIRNNAIRSMAAFKKTVEEKQNSGEFLKIPFSASVAKGLPEDVISRYVDSNNPSLIVMATRGKNIKKKEVIGSVTGAVIDSCRVPLFTVPENYSFIDVSEITNLIFFCNLDNNDILSFDRFMKMFSYPKVDITLVPVNEKLDKNLGKSNLNTLCDYFIKNYPSATFKIKEFGETAFQNKVGEFVEKNNIQLFIVPNKKRNIFERLFRPGIAHRFLFERDIPILALPV